MLRSTSRSVYLLFFLLFVIGCQGPAKYAPTDAVGGESTLSGERESSVAGCDGAWAQGDRPIPLLPNGSYFTIPATVGSVTKRLIVDGGQDIGSVTAAITSSTLTVTYVLTTPGTWGLSRAQLLVRSKAPGTEDPERFPFRSGLITGTSYVFTIPMSTFSGSPRLFVAAHARVCPQAYDPSLVQFDQGVAFITLDGADFDYLLLHEAGEQLYVKRYQTGQVWHAVLEAIDGTIVELFLDDRGLPTTLRGPDVEITFSNWSASEVDVVVKRGGSSQIHWGVPIGSDRGGAADPPYVFPCQETDLIEYLLKCTAAVFATTGCLIANVPDAEIGFSPCLATILLAIQALPSERLRRLIDYGNGTYSCLIEGSPRKCITDFYDDLKHRIPPPPDFHVAPKIEGVFPGGGVTGHVVEFRASVSGFANSYEWQWDLGGGAIPNTFTDARRLVTLGHPGAYVGTVRARNNYDWSEYYPFIYTVDEDGLPKVLSVKLEVYQWEGQPYSTNTLLTGIAGAEAKFTVETTNSPTSWDWNFGAGGEFVPDPSEGNETDHTSESPWLMLRDHAPNSQGGQPVRRVAYQGSVSVANGKGSSEIFPFIYYVETWFTHTGMFSVNYSTDASIQSCDGSWTIPLLARAGTDPEGGGESVVYWIYDTDSPDYTEDSRDCNACGISVGGQPECGSFSHKLGPVNGVAGYFPELSGDYDSLSDNEHWNYHFHERSTVSGEAVNSSLAVIEEQIVTVVYKSGWSSSDFNHTSTTHAEGLLLPLPEGAIPPDP
ncbi:MAG: hypothetical protein ABI743_02250 [bacterium]